MHYVDTSVLVAALLNEVHTDLAQRWLGKQGAGQLLISDWVVTEVSSALSLKIRTGAIDLTERTAALVAFQAMVDGSFTVLPLTRDHFHAAAGYADRHELNLRAGDALHLALVVAHRATLLTLDRRLLAACKALGVQAETV